MNLERRTASTHVRTIRQHSGRPAVPALQSCMRVTGAAGTYSAGPLATAYPATGYSAGYTDVGASVARGDAQFAGQRQAAQDSQTGTSYMAPTRPSTARTDHPTAHRPPQTAQAQTAQVQIDRQRTGHAAGRKDMPALQSYMRLTGAAGAYSAGPWPPPTLPLVTPLGTLVWAHLSPAVMPSLLASDGQHRTARQEHYIRPQPGHQRHARTSRRPIVRRIQRRPRRHRSRQTGNGLDRPTSLRLRQ